MWKSNCPIRRRRSSRREVRFQKLEQRSLELERERDDLRFTYDTAIRDELNARNELDSDRPRASCNGFATTDAGSNC